MDLNPLEDALGQEPQGEETHVEAPAPEPVAETPVAEAPAPETPPAVPVVPISAMLDEREKRQAAEKAYRELQDRMAAQQPQEAPAADESFAAALYAQNLRISRRFAEREHGAESVQAVHDWATARCDADPFFNAQIRASDDPYGAAFTAYNREQIAAKVSPERLAAFEAWEAAQAAAQAATPTPQPGAPPPPRSLAEAPGNGLRGGAAHEVGEGAAFNALFP